MIKETLNGTWRMRRVGQTQEYPAVVPGSVLSALIDAGAVDDPYFRDNEYHIRELFWHDYEFFRSFTVSAAQLSHEKIELVCHGLDTLAEIFLNGTSIAKTSDMHRTYRFPVGPLLREGENEIRIVFSSTLRYIENYRTDKGKEIERRLDAERYRAFPVPLADLYISNTRLTVTDQLNIPPDPGIGKLCAPIPSEHGMGFAQILIPPHGARRNIPDLFSFVSPIIFCDQNLYCLHIGLKPAGAAAGGAAALQILKTEPIDERDYTIGLRTLTVSQDEDEWGSEFCFQVNGIKLFSKGANYIPEDCIYSRITKQRIDMLLSSAKRANYNTIRVWGGGYYPSDTFYELCDRYGLIVWQDLMYACNVYELTDELEQNIIAETHDNAVRLRHHASLGLWCGNNEMESGWAHWPDFQLETPYARADYIKMFEYVLPKALREADDTTFYWRSSPSSGGCFDDPDDANRGDTHYWAVWHGQLPFSDYQNHFFRFCSEFGFQSFPCHKTVESYTLPEDRNIFSRVMEDHQKNDSANGKMLYYLSENFRYPKDFNSLLYVTQILQAVAVKSGVEHWRRNRGRCMGTLYWQINDNWPVASWASIDYFGRWKPLHYMAARFYAPVAGSLVRVAAKEGDACPVEAHCQNESPARVTVKASLSLKTMTFQVLRTVQAEAVLEPFTACCLLKEDYGELLQQEIRTSRPPEKCSAPTARHAREDVFVEAVFTITDEKGSVTKQTEQEVLLPYKYMRLQEVSVKAQVAEREDGKAYEIALTADAYAPFVTLDFDDADVILSDNCISITGTEPYVVTLDKEDIMNGSFADAQDVQSRLKIMSLRDTY